MPYDILIAEDEEITQKHLKNTLEREGHRVMSVYNGLDAWAMLEERDFDLLIADIKMPGMTGLDLLPRVKEKHPEVDVIIITGYGSIDSAMEAIKLGALDYITKPFELDELVTTVRKIFERKGLIKQNLPVRTVTSELRKISIIAKSASMNEILRTIESLKESECNIFLTGESGVGKSLLARIIHYTSRRQDAPFLSLNCATLTEELLASELFGHERGAFTGAVKKKQGLVEIANTGTLFLDEIAEMAPSLQAKLLKVIEEGEFYRVGGTRTVSVDVRFIAATNRNVKSIIAEGRFREDLYYRLNVMEIFIPPLRERKDDIEPLAMFLLEKHLPKSRKKISGISKAALKILKEYTYPGNVRELENIIERATILERSHEITPESLPQSLKMFQIETFEPGEIKTIEALNRDYVERVLDILGGNKTKAAEALGISRTSLWRILKNE
jgi:two-component system response regulator HydG